MIYELASPNGQRLLRSGVPVEVAIQHGEKRKNIKYHNSTEKVRKLNLIKQITMWFLLES